MSPRFSANNMVTVKEEHNGISNDDNGTYCGYSINTEGWQACTIIVWNEGFIRMDINTFILLLIWPISFWTNNFLSLAKDFIDFKLSANVANVICVRIALKCKIVRYSIKFKYSNYCLPHYAEFSSHFFPGNTLAYIEYHQICLPKV